MCSKLGNTNSEERYSAEQIDDIVHTVENLKQERQEILRGVQKCVECSEALVRKIDSFHASVDSRHLLLEAEVETGILKMYKNAKVLLM